jgi:hypothetical protein
MSDKIHCDLCDAVIDPTVQRLTLLVGLWQGNEGVDEEQHRDYCAACVEKDWFLKALFAEQLADVAESREPEIPDRRPDNLA